MTRNKFNILLEGQGANGGGGGKWKAGGGRGKGRVRGAQEVNIVLFFNFYLV